MTTGAAVVMPTYRAMPNEQPLCNLQGQKDLSLDLDPRGFPAAMRCTNSVYQPCTHSADTTDFYSSFTITLQYFYGAFMTRLSQLVILFARP